MTILITGGAGFLGQRLARRLLERGGAEQIVLVDQVAAPDFGDGRVRSVVADISDPAALTSLITPDVELLLLPA